MDDTFIRKVAALQANLQLLESQQGVLNDFQDMQALRRLKVELAEYIAGHAAGGELPRDPLAFIMRRLEALDPFLQQAVSESRKLRGWKEDWLTGIPSVTLADLQQAKTELVEIKQKLAASQGRLRVLLNPLDWATVDDDGYDLHPELRICAEIEPTIQLPDSDSSDALYGFVHGEGWMHTRVLRHFDEIGKRINELMCLHSDHLTRLAEAEAHLANQDFRSAETAIRMMDEGTFKGIDLSKVTSVLGKQMALIERFTELDSEIEDRLAKGEVKALRKELETLRVEPVNPNSELSVKILELTSRMDGVLASFLNMRKRRWMTISLVLILVSVCGSTLIPSAISHSGSPAGISILLGICVLFVDFAIGLFMIDHFQAVEERALKLSAAEARAAREAAE